ncbi:MAG: methylenetetrahydrofolate reductase [Deltaproteobacteria bacterium]|nr:methylenetetrahydrofolate reductase [Deltaproteobacteria bacterium]
MKLTEMWKTRGVPTISFELFPARSDKAAVKLDKAIGKLSALEPDFVSVTFGAGGSTRQGSLDLASVLKNEKGLEVLPYFACHGLSPKQITEVVATYRDLGVDNLLAVRGDEPRDAEDFTPHPESLAHASDLLGLLAESHDLCLGAACYPEGHVAAESLDADLEFVKLKVDCGAEFLIANYCYDNRFFFDLLERAAKAGIDVPIVAGVMPIYNIKMMENLAALCGATITDEVRAGIAALPEGDKQALGRFGIEYATEQCRGLIEGGVAGLHFYTMDRAKSVVGIVGNLREGGLL